MKFTFHENISSLPPIFIYGIKYSLSAIAIKDSSEAVVDCLFKDGSEVVVDYLFIACCLAYLGNENQK